jgi:hypothetical protein
MGHSYRLALGGTPGRSGPCPTVAGLRCRRPPVSSYPHLSEALPQLVPPEEVAPLLGMSTLGVVRQCRAGKLPGIKVGGRWLIHVRKLAEQLERGG